MKYWLAEIKEQNGEFEYSQIIRFQAETLEAADEIHKYYVSTWYGDGNMHWDENEEGFWNDCNLTKEGMMVEIDEHTFTNSGITQLFPNMTAKRWGGGEE